MNTVLYWSAATGKSSMHARWYIFIALPIDLHMSSSSRGIGYASIHLRDWFESLTSLPSNSLDLQLSACVVMPFPSPLSRHTCIRPASRSIRFLFCSLLALLLSPPPFSSDPPPAFVVVLCSISCNACSAQPLYPLYPYYYYTERPESVFVVKTHG